MNLDYSTNGGSTWTSIVTATPNDGSQAWTVPSTATTQGRVRVSGGTATDMSNANFTITVPSGSYATLPYSTGFEGGALDQYWSTAVTGDGRVRVLSTNTPHSGTYHMVMDDATAGGLNQTDARLRLNLTGQTQVNLSYWWKDFGDETHTQDGIFFSNNGGASYVKVASLNGGSFSDNTWRNFTLDVDAVAAANGLSLTSTFIIEFQQYDDYPDHDRRLRLRRHQRHRVRRRRRRRDHGRERAQQHVGHGRWPHRDRRAGVGSDLLGLRSGLLLPRRQHRGEHQHLGQHWIQRRSRLVPLQLGDDRGGAWLLDGESRSRQLQRRGRALLPMVDGYLSATSSYSLTVSGGLANSIIPQQKDFVAGKSLVVTSLLQNAPNPFTANTGIAFTLAQKGPRGPRGVRIRAGGWSRHWSTRT